MKEIADKHSCDPAAVMLAWGLQSGHSVIPKVQSPWRTPLLCDQRHWKLFLFLFYCFQRRYSEANLSQSLTPSRIKSNLAAQDVSLTDDELKTVDALNKGLRYLNPPWGVPMFVSHHLLSFLIIATLEYVLTPLDFEAR